MIFSYPRWRYPISGSASVIVSPSIFTRMFQSPWVIGCWGPMFTQNSAMSPAPRLQLPPADVLTLRLLREVLAQRVVPKVLGQQDPLELRVSVVRDPHEVPRFTFVVVRGVPQLHEADDPGVVVGNRRVDLDRRSRLVIVQVVNGLPVVLPVHRGDAREMFVAEVALQEGAHGEQVFSVNDRPDDSGTSDPDVSDLGREPRPELAHHVLFRPAHFWHRSEPPGGSYVDDGLFLQRVLGCDEQDWDESEEHRGEDRPEHEEPIGQGRARG